jgi:integrase
MHKLTDVIARKAGPGIYFDGDQRSPRGFMLRVTPAGARAWCLNYRLRDTGRERRITIGDVAAWPIAAARVKAAELRRIVDDGGDPLGQREERRAAPTVAELVERFVAEELPKRAPRTAVEYQVMLDQHAVPVLGRRKVSAVTREDVERLHRAITLAGKQRRANAVVAVVRIVFSAAVRWKLRPDNPASGIAKNPEHHRERYLNADELDRLMLTLERCPARRPDSCDAIRLLLLTGSRRGEVLGMCWADLDLDSAVWVKPAASTKQRRAHRVPLSPEAIELLRRRLAERDAPGQIVRLRRAEHVFKGGGDVSHINRLEHDWRVIRAAAGLEGVRLHDLRHTHASLLVGAGLSLPIIGAMLGHSKPATTSRYAYLADQPLREAAAIVGRIVGGKRPAS